MICTKHSNLLMLIVVGFIVGVVLGARERTFVQKKQQQIHANTRGRGRVVDGLNGRIVGQRQMLYDHYGRRLRITPKECQSSSPRYSDLDGICMFNLECQEHSGTVIGACVDRFLFGACCHISDPVKRKEILSGANSTTSGEVTASALLSPKPPPGNHQQQQQQQQDGFKQPSTPTILPSVPSSHETPHPTRFPSRGSGGSYTIPRFPPTPHTSLHSFPIPLGKHSAVPTPSNPVTLLPLTLETFSSVSDSAPYSPYGSNNPLRHEDGRPLESVESEALGLGFVVTRDKNKPRPSSTKIISSNSPPSLSNTQQTTPEPSKISTFMYLDNDDPKIPSTTTSTAQKNMTKQNSIAENTAQEQELGSNTENVWSVMMQLGSQDKLLNLAQSTKNGPLKQSSSPLAPAESVTSMMAELITGSSSDDGASVDDIKTDDSFDSVGAEEDISEGFTKYPPLKFFGDVAPQPGNQDKENDGEESATTEREETTKPWASSTYYVHTFKYPNFTQSGGSESNDDASNSNSNEKFNFVPSTMTTSFTSSTSTTAKPKLPSISSSTQPSVGKITTWSGIGTVVDKEQFLNKHGETTPAMVKSTTPTITTKKYYTTLKTTTTKEPSTTPSSTKIPTTKKPAPTEKWRKPAPYTLPPHKRPSTTEKEEETDENNASSEEEQQAAKDDIIIESDNDNNEDTVPEVKEEDDDEQQQQFSSSTTMTKMPSTSTKKPNGKVPIKKNSEKEKEKPQSMSSSIILDEDMDTNLDDFVEQVVQGLAGSLDNLNIDNVILSANKDDHSTDDNHNPHSDIDPLQEKITSTTTMASTTISTTTTTQKPLDWRKDCGVRTLPKSGRIVGGTASKFGRWPWQALVKEATWLGLFSKNKCGGVLIAPKYVLTAAHCQPGFLATLTVVLGEFDISSNSEGGANSITKNVRRVIVHRDYNAQTFENDIALLELDSPVDFKSHVVPICMPNDEEEFIGRKAFVTGWGRLKYGGGVPQILHEVDVPILKNDECQDMFHKSNHLKAIRDSFICAGYAEGMKDSCEGDSGGPLSIQRPSGQWVLAGTVSHGIKCAYPNLPGVYMRMTFYKPWIKRVTGIK